MGDNIRYFQTSADSAELLSSVPWLETVTDVLVHLILLGSAVAIIWVIVVLIRQDRQQMVLRILAMFTGALIVVGAQAAGVSYTSFIVDTLSVTNPLTFGVFGVLFPAALGTMLAWFIQRQARKDYDRAMNALVLFATMAVVQFLLTYVEAITENAASEVGRYAVPNISFVVGVFIYLLFFSKQQESDDDAGLLERLVGFVNRPGSRADLAEEDTSDPAF